MRQEIPAKVVSSTVTVVFDYTSDLAIGETLSSATTVAKVYSGADASPSAIVSGSTSTSGALATQTITAGVLGVLYELVCTAVSSAGQTLVKPGFLAVVPDL